MALRFYDDLARWWPLISPKEDYAEEAAYLAGLLRSAGGPVRRVLELGSGGGHMAWHLAPHFDLTLSDLSPAMLAVSARLNPSLEHVQGDMRSLRLGRTFDAVVIHDAIDYMTTETDLLAAMTTAAAHLEPGGLAVLLPDDQAGTFEGGTDEAGSDAADGSGARLFEWSYDPDPDDTQVRTEYVFLLRSADGTVEAVHETHDTGLFPETTWLRLLEQAGFAPEAVTEETTEDRLPRRVFLGRRR